MSVSNQPQTTRADSVYERKKQQSARDEKIIGPEAVELIQVPFRSDLPVPPQCPIYPFNLRPRFDQDLLNTSFRELIQNTTKMKYEILESRLYEATYTFEIELQQKFQPFYALDNYHHLFMMNEWQDFISPEILEQASISLDSANSDSQLEQKAYSLTKQWIEIWSGLIVKWGILDYWDYEHRWVGRSCNIKLLNMESIAKSLLSPDIIWYSARIQSSPLKDMVNEEAQQHGNILRCAIIDTFSVLLSLNERIIKQSMPGNEGLIDSNHQITTGNHNSKLGNSSTKPKC